MAVSGVLFFLLALGVGVIFLQIFLSKKDSKWAGLILPLISFMISLIVIMSLVLFSVDIKSGVVTENGVVIEQTDPATSASRTISGPLALSAVSILLIYNIPTAILIAIYFACSGNRRRQRDLDKMSIQDLE